MIDHDAQVPLVSVILTTYNRPVLVQQAIQSVVEQTYQNWELLVVDDGSDEESQLSLLNHLANLGDDRIVVWLTGRQDEDRAIITSYCAAINLGLRHAAGEYITYLCDDDLYMPQRLDRMVERLQDPAIFVVYGKQALERIDPSTGEFLGHAGMNGIPRPIPSIRPVPAPADTRAPAMRVDHSSVMHHVSCLEKGTWPEGPGNQGTGDAGFFRLLSRYYVFYHIDEILDVHRFHGDSICAKIRRGEWPPRVQ